MNKLYVAMITPFNEDNNVDYKSCKVIVDKLISDGIDGIIVCGTTGESSTLVESEKIELLKFVIKEVNHRCEIYFGCGSNSTAKTLHTMKLSDRYNFDGYLIVTPYYNLPTQYGLYEHFALLASYTDKPIILYNVPKRCGVSLKADTVIELAHNFRNIIALKQADHDLDMVKMILEHTENFSVYSGEDGYLLEGLNSGMKGIISVIAHIYTKELKKFLDDYEKGRDVSQQDAFFKMVSRLLFLETNPSCIKYVYAKMGLCLNQLRLPMTSLRLESEKQLDTFFK